MQPLTTAINKEQVLSVRATRKNATKVPANQFSFLKKDTSIFSLNSTLHNRVYEKFKDKLWNEIESPSYLVLERISRVNSLIILENARTRAD